jgi:hypothetical protein|tara:strand:+ start:4369 stop:4611 length:243 start_codon:yes stop_codon:yes gene_type:complete
LKHRRSDIAVIVHIFEEVINGREYKIEVSAVDAATWRAQLACVPGGASALMPFYGGTPDDAARRLTNWLALAHRSSVKAV